MVNVCSLLSILSLITLTQASCNLHINTENSAVCIYDNNSSNSSSKCYVFDPIGRHLYTVVDCFNVYYDSDELLVATINMNRKNAANRTYSKSIFGSIFTLSIIFLI
jgi:hypothetical protein